MTTSRNGGPPTPIDKVREVYDLAEEGLTVGQIHTKTGIYYLSVKRWLSDPGKYDPYIDETAVSRAIGGDVEVLDNLTIFERELVIDYFARIWNPLPYADQREMGIEMTQVFGERRWNAISNAARKRRDRAA